MFSRDVTFLDKSFGDWANVKGLTAEMIDTVNENDESDAPNWIPPNHFVMIKA